MDTAIGWALVLLPSLIYLMFFASYFLRGQARREHVERLLRVPYVRTFYLKAYRLEEGSAQDLAAQILPSWTQHVMPLVLCGLVALPLSIAAASVAKLPLGLPSTIGSVANAIPVEVLAGCGGAYLWGIVASIERFRVLNWTPGFIHELWVRVLIGGGLGGLVGVPFKAEYAPLLAFSLGAFPSVTLRRWLRRRAAKIIGLEEVEAAAPEPTWAAIQGIDAGLVERLEEADVASPTALANADPFQLLLRTNIPWRHLLDLIDQAILAGYLGNRIEKVRAMGIRGAIEMALLAERQVVLNVDSPIRMSADQTVLEISRILGQPDAATRTMIQNLDEDAQVELIWSLWFEEPAKGVVTRTAGEESSTAMQPAAVLPAGAALR